MSIVLGNPTFVGAMLEANSEGKEILTSNVAAVAEP